jgi:prepilin-type N-terminal cleavage/methylation domain-containing protein
MSRASVERRVVARGPLGFSLLEVLIVGALFSIVIAGVYLLYVTMQGTLTRGEMKADLQQNARVGLDRIVQELRMAGFDPQNALGNVPVQRYNEIRAAGNNCVSFVTYRTHEDGTDRSVRLTYSLDGTRLRRREDDWNPGSNVFGSVSTTPVAESVSQLGFTYYDAFNRILKPSGAVMGGCPPGSSPSMALLDATQAAQVRRVSISLRTLESRPNLPPESYTLTSHVYLRNR